MAMLEEEKKRSVQLVREQFSTTTNKASGQGMRVLNQILIVWISLPIYFFYIITAKTVRCLAVMTVYFDWKRSFVPDVLKLVNRQQRQQIADPFRVAVAHEFNPAIG